MSLKLQVCRQVINSSNEIIIKLDTKMVNWIKIFEKGRCEIPVQQNQTEVHHQQFMSMKQPWKEF